MKHVHSSGNGVPVIERICGGYRRVAVMDMLTAWHAYRTERRIRYFDWRVYLALHEVDERQRAARARKGAVRQRRVRAPGRSSVLRQCMTLVEVTDVRLVRAALARLQATQLVSVNEGEIQLCGHSGSEREPIASNAAPWGSVLRSRRSVPVPRPILRYLAGRVAVVEAAAMMAHVLRCVFDRGSQGWRSEGSCSASFVARVFGVHERSVKRATQQLIRRGWLTRLPADHWHVQAHGGRARITLTAPPGSGPRVKGCPESRLSPSGTANAQRLSLPESKPYLLTEIRNQPAASRGAVGSSGRIVRDRRPTLKRVLPADLRDPERVDCLHRQARERGWIKDSECDRLRVFAAATHALRIGRTNPCGLFVAVLKRGLWSYLSNVDEECGRARLRWLDAACETRDLRGCVEAGTAGVTDAQVDSTARLKLLVAELAASRSLPRRARGALSEAVRS